MLYLKKKKYLHCVLGEIKTQMLKCINAYICIVLVFELENIKKSPFLSKNQLIQPTS